MSKTKAEKSTTPLVNLIRIDIFYQITLIIGGYIVLGVLKLVDKVLDVCGMDVKFV